MAGNRVHRLGIAAVAGCAARIDQQHAGIGKALLHFFGRNHVNQRWPNGKVACCRVVGPCVRAGFNRVASHLPGLQATVENGHSIVPQPFQHPPQATAKIAAVAVIHNRLHVVGKAPLAQGGRKIFAQRQRVPPLAGCALGRMAAEMCVQIGMARARNMRLCKLLLPGSGIGQVVAAIKNHQRLAAALQGIKLLGRNQGGVWHGWMLSAWLQAALLHAEQVQICCCEKKGTATNGKG